jgi:hypothetical protein
MPRNDEIYRDMDAQQQFDNRRADDQTRQDALLDQIHGGVVGLKNQAHAINGEVVEQNIMIDDLGNVSLAAVCLQLSGREADGNS